MHLSSVFRTNTLAGLLFLGAVLCGGAVRAEVPSFVKETIYSPNVAAVAKIVPSLSADLVVLDGGLEQGLRRGMVCTVSRGFQFKGEIIIIESRSDRSAGLILELVEDATITAGDIARIKTIQTS